MSFYIVTDSCCDLPESKINTYDNFAVEKLSFLMDGKPRPDLDVKGFYNCLRNGGVSQTSQINQEQFITRYNRILDDTGKDILYIGFSSALSGTYFSGDKAREIVQKTRPDAKIITVDSLSASLGLGYLVDEAVRMRDGGASIDETANWLENNKLCLNHWFTVDDLYFLQRGGRVTATQAWFGSVLNIKPVLNMNNLGQLIPREKVRGRKQSIAQLFRKMEQYVNVDKNRKFFISHGDCYEEAKTLADMIVDKWHIDDSLIYYVGPVIGSHTGPGVVALFFMGNAR